MGPDLDAQLVQQIVVAVIGILVYLVKKSIDRHLDDIKASLVTINSNISNTQIVNIHPYPAKVKPDPPEDDET